MKELPLRPNGGRGRWLLLPAGGVLLLAVAVGWAYWQWRGSLPVLEGEFTLAGLQAPVTVDRDAAGIATIEGADRRDVARATGFLHAQERYWQMDLLRRAAAGELAELVGVAALERDRSVRVHRFRAGAQAALVSLPAADRELLVAYTDGVNAGLRAQAAPSFEYRLLGVSPAPWQAEDSLLTIDAMYLKLQGNLANVEAARGLLDERLPPALAAFLAPPGTEWDAPLEGAALPAPPLPGPEVIDLRLAGPGRVPAPPWSEDGPLLALGSNNWAVAGWRTAHGGALLANDMHLELAIPNIWYRATFVYPDAGGRERRITGVTLPGMPAMVAGGNGRAAWGFTNAEGDWADLVVLEAAPDRPDAYRTPAGPQPFVHYDEVIRVHGDSEQRLDVRWTIWGPVIDRDHQDRERALRWVAHDPGAVNLELLKLETADGVAAVLAAGQRAGMPTQNLLAADAGGHIGWTLAGPLPRRFGHSGRVPSSWADGRRGWDGRRDPAEYPQIVDPPSGLLWTANNRVVGGDAYTRLGDGNYALGARASQIRDALFALERPAEAPMLALQLDDRALFLQRWRELLLDMLTPNAVATDPRRGEFRRLVEQWGGRAAVDSVGYRLVRAFRLTLARQVFAPLTAACVEADPRFDYALIRQQEGPLWQLVSTQPPHLLNPAYPSWPAQMLAAVDEVLEELTADGTPLAQHTWGERNTIRVAHPFSARLPLLGRWLDMPALPLPGDDHMPRVQTPSQGASERLVLSPGREADGVFHMPVGQSGHPLSPYYGAGHDDWAKGAPSPFLPGPPVYTLRLRPVAAHDN